MNYNCPDCTELLEKVYYPSNSMLNEEQFNSVRAGDYYCRNCKGNRGNTGFRYFWESELEQAVSQSSPTKVLRNL
jgi:hypothetical protein